MPSWTPRSPEQLIAFLREEAARRGPYNRQQIADAGQSALIERSLLAHIPDAEAFLKRVYGIPFEFMTRSQFYALRDWLLAPRDTSKAEAGTLAYQPQAVADLRGWIEADDVES